jgi:hypothetical protein
MRLASNTPNYAFRAIIEADDRFSVTRQSTVSDISM